MASLACQTASFQTTLDSRASLAPAALDGGRSLPSLSARLGPQGGSDDVGRLGSGFWGQKLRSVAPQRASAVAAPSAGRLRVVAMAPPKAGGKAKKVVGMIKLALEAGKATPAPPVGPALGAKGVNIMMFCKEYNAKTADKAGYVIPVEITVFDDKSFTFVLKTPPASVLLLKAAGAARGSSNPGKEKVGKVTVEQVREIATEKLPDLNCTTVDAAMRIIAGTAANMGIDVVPPILEKKQKVVL
ncbi:unnamed protein product [Closterium sp. NIES-64]|nr:unnamed protein product [Closterium sp. NIES-65]CAI5949797.1 unnamed protein product [Closterium sp. NIES-64]